MMIVRNEDYKRWREKIRIILIFPLLNEAEWKKIPSTRWLSFVDQYDDDENHGYDNGDENDNNKKHTHTMTFQ